MRGGTSKALFFHEKDLPTDPEARDRLLLSIYGSPDPYGCQLDGMGGAQSITSKVAVISASADPRYDVNYCFGQVAIDKPVVGYGGNCGNISAGVGPFAIEEGLVTAQEPVTMVRIHQVNTGKLIVAEVPVQGKGYQEEGDYAIDGVPGSGGKIILRFVDPGGPVTGKLLPSGNVRDRLDLPGLGQVEVSIVDAGNPVVFVLARALGLAGTEIDEIDERSKREQLESIRSRAAVLLGLAASPSEATRRSQDVPKIAVVGVAQDYRTASGQVIHKGDIDIAVRMMSMGCLHKACSVTGAICTTGAAKIEGTVVNEALSQDAIEKQELRLGHPAGVLSVGASLSNRDGRFFYEEAIIGRTARRLMDGFVYAREGPFID
jgi:2-methylaconitate cis-trans-isomerase PrpF